MNISSRLGRLIFAASIILATFAGLALVTASPLALRSLANLHQFDWPRLSNVGQTYGAISAMLVVIGLSGVAVTVFLQVRESRHTRVQAARTRHYDLMRMALDVRSSWKYQISSVAFRHIMNAGKPSISIFYSGSG